MVSWVGDTLRILGGNMQRIYNFGWFGQELRSIRGIDRVVGFTEGFRPSTHNN